VVDLSDPAAPRLRGEIMFTAELPPEYWSGDGGAFFVRPDPAFGFSLAARWSAQPEPTQIPVHRQPAFVQEIAVDGQLAYVVGTGPGDGALYVVDVSDPDQPREVALLQLRLPPK